MKIDTAKWNWTREPKKLFPSQIIRLKSLQHLILTYGRELTII